MGTVRRTRPVRSHGTRAAASVRTSAGRGWSATSGTPWRARTRAGLEWADGDRASVDAALDAAIARGAPLVVAIGGDGTIRLAADRLVGTGIPLAVVPGGTGNLFSGALGLPVGRSAAIRAIAEGGDATWTPGASWSVGARPRREADGSGPA